MYCVHTCLARSVKLRLCLGPLLICLALLSRAVEETAGACRNCDPSGSHQKSCWVLRTPSVSPNARWSTTWAGWFRPRASGACFASLCAVRLCGSAAGGESDASIVRCLGSAVLGKGVRKALHRSHLEKSSRTKTL